MDGDSELQGSGHSEEHSRILDRTLSALASHRRRTILRILREAEDTSIPFSDLVTETIAREDGDHFIDHDRVILDLHHRQLPLLAETGVVEYDRNAGIIRYNGDDEIEALLQSDRSQNRENKPLR